MKSQKQDSWFKRHKILSVVLIILGLLTVIGMFGDSDQTNQNTKNPGTSNKSKEYRFVERADKQSTDIELSLGEAGTVNGVQLIVHAAEYKTSLGEFDNAKNGETYIQVAVNLKNTSDGTKPYNPFNFRVQTASGQVLDPYIFADNLDSGDLVSGGTVSGIVNFEVPIEESHQYLIWKPGLASDRAIVQLK